MPDSIPQFDEADTDALIALLVEMMLAEWVAEQAEDQS